MALDSFIRFCTHVSYMEIPPKDYMMGQQEAWKSKTRNFLVSAIAGITGVLFSYYIFLTVGFNDVTNIDELVIFLFIIGILVPVFILLFYFLLYQVESSQNSPRRN